MKILEIKSIDNFDEAKKVWTELSPDKVLCDNWDFRYCFYKYFNYPLHFYIGLDNGEIVGLLPLQYNKDTEYLEFFGGGYMRDNCVFIKPGYKECIPQFYSAISQNITLKNITGNDPYTTSLHTNKYKYVADFSDIKDIEDYFSKRFKAKKVKKIKKIVKTIESLNPTIVEDNYHDLDLLIEINKINFGKESTFNKPYRWEIFHDLLKLNFEVHILTFIINDNKEAVSFSIKYKDTYVGISSGTRKNNIMNIGTYINYKKICKAIQSKAKYYDAGLHDAGWKEKWRMKKIPQYIFIN